MELLRASNADVALSHGPWPHLVLAPAVRRCAIPVVLYLHAPIRLHWLDQLALRVGHTAVLANSEFTKLRSARYFKFRSVDTCYYPVFDSVHHGRSTLRDELNLGEQVVVLQASRLDPYKGFELHIRALALLREDPRWVALFVGGPQSARESRYVARLKSLAEKLGITSRVRFLGHRSDVRALMEGADIFCQPNSGPEPYGLVFVEALYAALPIVTTGMGGAAEILAKDWGVQVLPEPSSVAVALSRLIASRDARRALGRLGPERARFLCDPSKALKALEDKLGGLTDRARSADGGSQSWV